MEDREEDKQRRRALLWLGFLPQLLQRKPTRRGRKGRAEVSYPYNEYVMALGERMEDREVKQLEELGLVYLAGELPPSFYTYRIWLCIQTGAL